MPKPGECESKQDIRSEIDRIDRALIALLAERFAYVSRMAELKQEPGEAFVRQRVDDVLDRVTAEARASGLDEALVRTMWKALIDWNVEYERRTIAARRREDE